MIAEQDAAGCCNRFSAFEFRKDRKHVADDRDDAEDERVDRCVDVKRNHGCGGPFQDVENRYGDSRFCAECTKGVGGP